jgi:hypothetical protein
VSGAFTRKLDRAKPMLFKSNLKVPSTEALRPFLQICRPSTHFFVTWKPFNSLINRQKLTALLGIKDNDQLSKYHRNWVEEVFKNGSNQRDAKWTEAIAACPFKSGFLI